jgi:hypothetical protein
LPYPHVVAGVAVGQPGLTEHRVLKGEIVVLGRDRLDQAPVNWARPVRLLRPPDDREFGNDLAQAELPLIGHVRLLDTAP